MDFFTRSRAGIGRATVTRMCQDPPLAAGWGSDVGQMLSRIRLLAKDIANKRFATRPSEPHRLMLTHLLGDVVGELVDSGGGTGQPVPKHEPNRWQRRQRWRRVALAQLP